MPTREIGVAPAVLVAGEKRVRLAGPPCGQCVLRAERALVDGRDIRLVAQK
jgi:hypothetical protein